MIHLFDLMWSFFTSIMLDRLLCDRIHKCCLNNFRILINFSLIDFLIVITERELSVFYL